MLSTIEYHAARNKSPTPTPGAGKAAGVKRKAEGEQPAAKRKCSETPPVGQVSLHNFKALMIAKSYCGTLLTVSPVVHLLLGQSDRLDGLG